MTARPRRSGLRRVSVVALIMLVVQYGLGMIVNFYVEVPAADGHGGIFTEIATAPLPLTLHALLGVSLAGTAILAVSRAMRMRDRLLSVLAAAGLAAIVGAFVAGEMFVKNGQDSLSFAMAMLTGAALLCYVATLALTAGTWRAQERETQPLLVSVPAAREPEDDPDLWGAEPGWDDDPGWAERLRQDEDPGWPGHPGWPQRQAQRPQAQHPQAQPWQVQPRQAQFRQAQRPRTQGPYIQGPRTQGPPDWWEHP
jgi:hypothetical protein